MQNIETPAITWLNMSGDITISWTKDNEAAILALVEEKMKKGFSFFIIKPRFFGLLSNKKIKAQSIEEVRAAGTVVALDDQIEGVIKKLYDKDVETVVSKGVAKLVKPSTAQKEMVRRAQSAEEVLEHQTVAIRPIVGG